MIQKYYLLSEILGYFSIIAFIVNLLLLLPPYIKALKAELREFSIIWLVINSFLLVFQLVMLILFLTNLISPWELSHQGKTDLITSEFTISISIAFVVITLIALAVNTFAEKYFSCYLSENIMYLSYRKYDKSFLRNETNGIYYKKDKKVISSKCRVGKFISHCIK